MGIQEYEKVKVVGKGSFGAAWLVKRKKDGKKLIAKEVQMGGMKPAEKDEARNEVRLLSQIRHPNITAYHEHFESSSSLFIVMEYADGGDMAGKIRSQKNVRLKEEKIMHYFAQICLALNYLHDRHTLHRDIKCQNIFLTSNGVVKLGDFGIATVLRNTMALARTVCGTPYYFSPELCQNKPYNNKSDVWALGCVLYEITTLQHAFEGQNMKILMQKIIKGVYPPISWEYGKDLRELIGRMLSRNCNDRPSMNQIIATPYVANYICTLGKVLDDGIHRNEPMVPKEERRNIQLEARDRVLKHEEVARQRRQDNGGAMDLRRAAAQREAEALIAARKEKEREREERDRAERAGKMERLRLEQQARMQEAQQRGAEEEQKRQAEKEKRRKQRDEELEKWRERKRQEEREQQKDEQQRRALDRQREDKWDRQMAKLEEERRAAEEAASRDAEERAKAAGKAYWEMRNAAAQNRRRAGLDEAPSSPQTPVPHAKGTPGARASPGGYDGRAGEGRDAQPDERKKKQLAGEELIAAQRQAFFEMKREAARNKARLADGGGGCAEEQNAGSPSAPPSAPATPQREREEPVSREGPTPPPHAANAAMQDRPLKPHGAPTPEERREAYIAMQREAKRNRDRMREEMGLPVQPPSIASPPRRANSPELADEVDREACNAEPEADADLEQFVNDEAVMEGNAVDEKDAAWVGDYKGMLSQIEAIRSSDFDGSASQDFSDAPTVPPNVHPDIQHAHTLGKFFLDGKTLNLPNVKSGDPLMYRIEALRMFLSRELSEQRFVQVYRQLDSVEEDASENVMSEVESLLGDKLPLLQLISQLIFCEDQFNAQQNQPM